MFRFEDPAYLWLLLVLPLLVIIYMVAMRRRTVKLRKFGDAALISDLMPDASKARPALKFGLLLGALALAIIMLARPQMGSKISHDTRNGIEAIIAIDISNSMLAQDVVPSRLEKSKMLVENLVDRFTKDRIGLVVYAGDAFVQLPITTDYVSAKMFLHDISPALISTQGTDIARAISVSMNSFTQQKDMGKAIILITDGEDHEGGALEAAREAKKKGINVFILGVGSASGAPIPQGNGDYLKDNTGNVVMSALNENMCKDIAKAGNGTYIHVDNTSDAQDKLNMELEKLQKGETDNVIYSEYNEQFQAIGILVLILLILEVCVLEVKNPRLRKLRLFRNRL